jgi:hypothetical protein
MKHTDQITAFAAEIDRVVERFRDEFEIPVVSVIGVFQLKQHLLLKELAEDDS